MASYWYEESQITTSANFIAMVASVILCWIIFKVKMKRCEHAFSNMATLLHPLQKAAANAATRQRVVKAATLVVEKTLAEYKSLITMLRQTPEAEFDRDDFPPLRQVLEEETIKAQVQMVKDCLTAASTELLKSLPEPAEDLRQENVLSSLYEQGQLVTTISEEILTALGSRKRMSKPYRVRNQVSSYDERPGQREWHSKVL